MNWNADSIDKNAESPTIVKEARDIWRATGAAKPFVSGPTAITRQRILIAETRSIQRNARERAVVLASSDTHRLERFSR